MRQHSAKATIAKIYASNFFTGLVFWYGIEKLFMQHIGLTATDIGVLTAIVTVVPLLLDVPAGLVADRWSRKGLLMLAIVFIAASGVTEVTSHGSLLQYAIGYAFYGLYLVSTSGTYQALTYDVLYEAGRANEYSKVMGRAYGLFLVGAGVANISSGFMAYGSLELPYWATLASCALNLLVLATIREPTFHKREQKEKMLQQLRLSVRTIWRTALLRSLVLVTASLSIAEVYKQDFSQLYMLAFTNSPLVLGLLWAAFAFAWAGGSFLAHYLSKQLNVLLVLSFGCLVALGFITAWWGLIVFMIQAMVSAAAYNLIETRIQNETPSGVRASVLSVATSFYRIVYLPFTLLFGWIIANYSVFGGWQLVGAIAAVALLYWLFVGRLRLQRTKASATLNPSADDFAQP